MASDGNNTNEGDGDYEDEEEMIEEDICGHGESPLINAKTKQATGHKAKVLFHGEQPPVFRSTESERFNMDTAMTGFGPMTTNKGAAPFNYAAKKEKSTPMHDKSSILGSKPFLGGKPRHQLIKSPDRSFNSGYHPQGDFNSAGGLGSEMRQVNQRELQREIEEEIRVPHDPYMD